MTASQQDAPQRASSPGPGSFEVMWRGYDRDQVDEHIRELTGRLHAERQRAEAAQRELLMVQNELASAQQASVGEGSNGFGHRLEKVMRIAENEVAESRRKAAEEAAALMEKARAAAEAHRHEVEQQLIARAANLDQEAARRSAALQERENEVAAELATAKQQTEELRSDAERDADRVRQEADAVARQVRARAEKAAQQQRDLAAREVSHLVKLQDEARAEIGRLHQMLGAELELSANGGRDREQED